MFQGEQDRGAACGTADLGVDVLDMTVSCLGGDDQVLGDLGGGQPGRRQREHLRLAGGKTCRQSRGPAPGRMNPHGPDLQEPVASSFAKDWPITYPQVRS